MVTSLIGEGALRLDCLEDLPSVIGAYECSYHMARSSGDVQMTARYSQIVALLKKLELPLFGPSCREKALSKWMSAEALCKETNAKCLDILKHPLTHSHDELGSVISDVAREIQNLIGYDPPDLDEVVEFMRFGPGSDLTHTVDEGDTPSKLCSMSSYPWLLNEVLWLNNHTMMREVWHPSLDRVVDVGPERPFPNFPDDGQIRLFDHAKYSTVPKSITEDRSIEIGPTVPGLLQQAYDGFLRRRLKEGWGVDLRNQLPNKELARVGSILGECPNSPCTIDLSSASDTIAFGLVALCLPPAWFNTLKRYRAKSIVLPDGTIHSLEKFSSMGNALTFSLQTLIFSAVVRSVLRLRGWEGSRWRCYGDDIIVPRRAYDEVCRRLTVLGFVINETKSFANGHFRESCGGDYLHGIDIRPFYIKKPIQTVADLYKYLNLLQVYAARGPIPAACFRDLYKWFLLAVPRELRLYGDSRFALDNCIWAPVPAASKFHLRRRQDDVKVPGKLAYLSKLFLPNPGCASDCQRRFVSDVDTGTPGVYVYHDRPVNVDVSWLKRLKSDSALLTREGGWQLRRPRLKGPAVYVLLPSELAFDPTLIG